MYLKSEYIQEEMMILLRKKRFLGFLLCSLGLIIGLAMGGFAAQKVTINWWMGHWWGNQGPKIVEAFEKEYPEIKVNFDAIPSEGYPDKMITSCLGGTAADATAIWTFMLPELFDKELLSSFEKYLDKFDMEDFIESGLEMCTFDGELIGIPYRLSLSESCIFYNKDMLDEAGLSYPTLENYDDWTYEVLRQYAMKLTKPPQYGYGLMANGPENNHPMVQLVPAIRTNGGRVISEDGTVCLINEKAAIEAVQWWVDLYIKDSSVPPGSINNGCFECARMFGAEKIAMFNFHSGGYEYASQTATREIPIGVVPVPGYQSIVGGWALTIPKGVPHPEEAAEFIAWFTKNLGEWTIRPPSTKSALEHPNWKNPRMEPFNAAMAWGEPWPAIPEWNQTMEIVVKEYQQALLQMKTVEQAMNDAAEKVNQIL